jgi:hypothetical protein
MCNYIYELECTCRYFTWIKKDINGNEVSKTRLFKMITNDYVDYGRRMIVLSGKDDRHRFADIILDFDKAYVNVLENSGTITTVNLPSGGSYTTNQAEADLIFFVQSCLEGC